MSGNSNLPTRIAEGTTTVRDVSKLQAIIFAFLLGGCLLGAGLVFLLTKYFGG